MIASASSFLKSSPVVHINGKNAQITSHSQQPFQLLHCKCDVIVKLFVVF